ncbi:hypothetical protein V1389_14545 [Flavobacterium rakeshii]|uniref:hypothetical protein n=1 Tax=Flavobacterium rakeshii TaxID=1038845 RepID=UPI002E7C0706|nr:hypothetical protein [Flavobacterium rakeshii]MEE1899565.1 hypothetical protein [Flavobacterium rakeshii]
MDFNKTFSELADHVIKEATGHTFNLAGLPPYDDVQPKIEGVEKVNIRLHGELIPLFQFLDSKENHCLYWFELEDNDSCMKLNEILNEKREALRPFRTVPCTNKNSNSNVLYVGIRRGGFTKKYELSNIAGRMIQHLGYYQVGTTQGLQLIHWAAESNLKVTIKVYEFEKEFPNHYLGSMEKIVAHKLQPLSGKH